MFKLSIDLKVSVLIIESNGPILLGLLDFAAVALLDILCWRKKYKLQFFQIINTNIRKLVHAHRLSTVLYVSRPLTAAGKSYKFKNKKQYIFL